ncbi:MAG: bifunctional glycosyltransferase family 2 protein/CDP-glycerol:glycerophosphate glycerophosphotransferase, partial [Ruminococcus sp.]|nr:bifunctional glycosyltransferase family 2 protein/CDP-glycerol:glycerophosphate glycerophosphotransferase [Ruminococcus sp.]
MSVKVSIIMAVGNDMQNLKSALDSIKSQSFKDIEVIMIDAASNDGSQSIMKGYCADKRFSYQRIESNSISNARNLAMEKAKGKYLAFGDASVIFSKRLIEGMYECAEREDAQLCVAPMASSDVYGKHEFKSTGILSRRKKTNKFDTDLIWNPAVTNKLFLKSKVEQLDLKFNAFGKAREAAFSLPFAFESDVIVCSSKGAASYIIPVKNGGVAQFPIQHYLDAYDVIIEKAELSFSKSIAESVTDFDRKELEKIKVCYIDQVFLKEITVLLYSYYRHFWSLEDALIKEYTAIINSLIGKLSSRGKKTLLSMNKDIFYDGRLIDNKAEMAKNPKVTVCIGKSEKRGHLHEKRLFIQVSSIFNQTMPGFKLFVDERLREIFPKEWLDFPNVEFVQAHSLGEFKDLALEKCGTDYIMYQDGFARLNPKILMRHYMALAGREKYGFTTSPLTQFDGNRTKEYSFSDLSFYSDMKVTRASESSNTFVLDLFFCNKLFRTDHLNGIHFTFSDNPVIDMYKLYEHSRFKKLLHRGSYLPYNEEEALALLKAEQNYLPMQCRIIYKKYKSVYRKRVTHKKHIHKFVKFAKMVKRFIVGIIEKLLVFVFSHMRIKNRAFFYTIRSNGKLLENSRFVYDGCKCSKVVFAKMLPHSFVDACKVKMYMLTSKVIVTDDYLKYLRSVRLRDGQKVIQIWHASGAFKRFGLDAPSRLTRI